MAVFECVQGFLDALLNQRHVMFTLRSSSTKRGDLKASRARPARVPGHGCLIGIAGFLPTSNFRLGHGRQRDSGFAGTQHKRTNTHGKAHPPVLLVPESIAAPLSLITPSPVTWDRSRAPAGLLCVAFRALVTSPRYVICFRGGNAMHTNPIYDEHHTFLSRPLSSPTTPRAPDSAKLNPHDRSPAPSVLPLAPLPTIPRSSPRRDWGGTGTVEEESKVQPDERRQAEQQGWEREHAQFGGDRRIPLPTSPNRSPILAETEPETNIASPPWAGGHVRRRRGGRARFRELLQRWQHLRSSHGEDCHVSLEGYKGPGEAEF
ncbi:hypothetical protein FIBSPDRAFT_964481 [Athelia psychrophila]|uniref:Uncharacterized protein n=1 Tax=Athelia psychrophila TaxID=1759441 RepID=A0A165XPJ2_9AGAM|nr:hypothetical protein FIBSPDRAFT_964481 [Fibularhizoctonia sp. CBS 109695]